MRFLQLLHIHARPHGGFHHVPLEYSESPGAIFAPGDSLYVLMNNGVRLGWPGEQGVKTHDK